MSERIYAAVNDDFIRRMRNWANAEAGVSMSAISSIYDGMPGDGWGNDAPIVLEGEAQDTSAALMRVSPRYRQVVMQFWRYEGRPLRWHGRHRGIDYHTFEAWVIKGHEELKSLLAAHTAAYHRTREAKAKSVRAECKALPAMDMGA